MNILFISTLYPSQPLESNEGVTLALHKLVKRWNQADDVDILVIRPVFLYLREIFKKKLFFRKKMITIDNVKIIVYPVFKIPKLVYFYYPLIRFLKRNDFKPGVVIAHFDKSLTIGVKFAASSQRPLIAGLHIAPDLMENNPAAFDRRCGRILQAASAIACRSLYIYNKIRLWYPQFQEKCFIAPSGIEEKLIRDKAFALAKLNRWKNHKSTVVHILSVSILVKRKNIDTVLKALALLEEINWKYTIIGDGEERTSLEALALNLGIADRVEFKGTKPHHQVIEEMEQSHIFVMVSHLETFGLVYLEALATGNIVIGSSGEGIEGVMENGKNGFLSPAGEVEPLKNILEKIILHLPAAKLENILVNAHHTLKQYTDKNAAQNYMNRLNQVVRRGSLG